MEIGIKTLLIIVAVLLLIVACSVKEETGSTKATQSGESSETTQTASSSSTSAVETTSSETTEAAFTSQEEDDLDDDFSDESILHGESIFPAGVWESMDSPHHVNLLITTDGRFEMCIEDRMVNGTLVLVDSGDEFPDTVDGMPFNLFSFYDEDGDVTEFGVFPNPENMHAGLILAGPDEVLIELYKDWTGGDFHFKIMFEKTDSLCASWKQVKSPRQTLSILPVSPQVGGYKLEFYGEGKFVYETSAHPRGKTIVFDGGNLGGVIEQNGNGIKLTITHSEIPSFQVGQTYEYEYAT